MQKTQLFLETVFFPATPNPQDRRKPFLSIHVLNKFMTEFEKLAEIIEARLQLGAEELLVWHLKFYEAAAGSTNMEHLTAKVSLVTYISRQEIASYPKEITLSYGWGEKSANNIGFDAENSKGWQRNKQVIAQIIKSLNRRRTIYL